MPRIPENRLTIKPLPKGRFLLFGHFLGEKIRKRSRDYNLLATIKAEKELELLNQQNALAGAPSLKLTRLTNEQLQDAEAATEMARGRRLVECVAAAERVLPPIDAVSCEMALSAWLEALQARKRSGRTLDKNERRVRDFLAEAFPAGGNGSE